MYKTISPEKAIELFWSKVNKNGPIPKHCPELGHCWEWLAGTTNQGYGRFGNEPRISSHRYSWEITNGKVPDGLYVLHKCDNPRCVNPSHLFIGTAKDNTQDMINKQRQTGRSIGRPKGATEATLLDMQKILDFVKQYVKDNKIAPTLTEIAVGIGRKPEDFGNVQPMVKKLIAEGFLVSNGRVRSLTVAQHPPRKFFYKPQVDN